MVSFAGASFFTVYTARPHPSSNGSIKPVSNFPCTRPHPSSNGSIKPVSNFPNTNHIKALQTRHSRLSIPSTSVHNGAISKDIPFQRNANLRGDNAGENKGNLECLLRYDKAVPEQLIDKPIGLSLSERKIGNNPRCMRCEAKGVVLCPTCTGSGLYVDSILESQGIIVKVRCLGCGGNGNIMCSNCGGRGHL